MPYRITNNSTLEDLEGFADQILESEQDDGQLEKSNLDKHRFFSAVINGLLGGLLKIIETHNLTSDEQVLIGCSRDNIQVNITVYDQLPGEEKAHPIFVCVSIVPAGKTSIHFKIQYRSDDLSVSDSTAFDHWGQWVSGHLQWWPTYRKEGKNSPMPTNPDHKYNIGKEAKLALRIANLLEGSIDWRLEKAP